MHGFRKKVDAVVYTMGKVGSSTVSTSVKAAGLNCLDVHFLQEDRITRLLDHHVKNPDVEIIPEHFIDSILARNAIVRQQTVRIISLVRNPIMRNISAVFQNTPERLGDDFEAVMERLQAYPTRTPDNWFEEDFIPVTGVDIFSAQLDRTADHFRFSKGKLEILILKLEADDERKSALISAFLGQEVALSRANEASKKWYYDLYRRIAADPKSIRWNFVEECMNLKYYKAFYAENEINTLADRFA